MKILYYITSHGYGHALRSSVISAAMKPDDEVVFRTTAPREFFAREMARSFTYAPASFDCGCVQPDGASIDIGETLARYKAIADRNRDRLDEEVNWCKDCRIDVVVSDIVPFAFDVAQKAGLPSVAATNFTWHTIYEEYAAENPDFKPYLDEIRNQYAKADVALAMYPPNNMDYFKKIIAVGPVGRIGANIRERLLSEHGEPFEKKIGLIYTGNFGMADVAWERLEQFDQWVFFGLYPLPKPPKNFHLISTKNIRYQDCIASADVMITKLGYGACAECFINGLPIIYLPRDHFAEYPVLQQAVKTWGHGYFLSKDDFCSLNYHEALRAAFHRPQPMSSDGANTCAAVVRSLA